MIAWVERGAYPNWSSPNEEGRSNARSDRVDSRDGPDTGNGAGRRRPDGRLEGMRTANPGMVREVFAPDARFAVLDRRDGPARLAVQGVDGWIAAIGESGGQWNEQIYDVVVHVDRDMASIWAPYTFYLEGGLRHCGINSIELLRGADGWKVTQLSDTRQTEDCPDPLGG